MSRVEFTRLRKIKEEPLVSIWHGRFHFNANFARDAQLEKANYVKYHIDEENREIAFEFLKSDPDGNAFRLVNLGGRSKWPSKFTCAGRSLIKSRPWVELAAAELGTFRAVRDGKLWVIRLTPSFEEEVLRVNAGKISPEASGIYRYISADDQVVYIGKGNVRQRLSDADRADWKFDKIQYSIVREKGDQSQWENFWLERHVQANNGRLPYYNRQGGNKV
jgi:hypothetical protein